MISILRIGDIGTAHIQRGDTCQTGGTIQESRESVPIADMVVAKDAPDHEAVRSGEPRGSIQLQLVLASKGYQAAIVPDTATVSQ